MNAALKEWSSVVGALDAGAQILLLRKGGIVEADRGGFALRYSRFLLFPTYEHEHTLLVRDAFRSLLKPSSGSGKIEITMLCEVTDVFVVSGEEALHRAGPHFIWNHRFVNKRLAYKPELPLYAILLRAARLATPARIPERPSYAGCKSWVHLTEDIEVEGAVPVLSDDQYASKRHALLACLR